MVAALPAPSGVPYRIAMVCLGNICRSPMAAVVLEAKLADAGLDDLVEVTSSGTGGWHAGEPMDRRAAAKLLDAGYDPSIHRAKQFDAEWFDNDLILAMDADNLADICAIGGSEERVRLFRSFDPAADPDDPPDVPDPWYGGPAGFAETLAIVERTDDALVAALAELLG